MTYLAKDKRHPGVRDSAEKARKRESVEVCEICGQIMQRDPESGENFCPDCYDTEDKP
ncbi:MAG TPA: hypothetical protein VFG19_11910 [Geobacteraceae bacterium]|nr:hypothetical protein [Geobacteraceae bacterium]